MALDIVIDQESDESKKRTVNIATESFDVRMVEPHNLWEIHSSGSFKKVPKVLSGRFTSPEEAYKAISIYSALNSKDTNNGNSTPPKSDSR